MSLPPQFYTLHTVRYTAASFRKEDMKAALLLKTVAIAAIYDCHAYRALLTVSSQIYYAPLHYHTPAYCLSCLRLPSYLDLS